jgi:ABC-type transport system involved in multi-copper enzyme maturation permease subunit
VGVTRWVQRLTPTAGLAIQQTRDRFDTAIGPWAGFGVLCAYAAVALGAAYWLLRRRDA